MNRIGRKNAPFANLLSVRQNSRKVPERLRRAKNSGEEGISVTQLSSKDYSKFARWDWILRFGTIGAISAAVYFANKDKIKRHRVYGQFEELVDRKYDLNVWTRWLKLYNELPDNVKIELLTLLRDREEEPVWWELLRNERSLEFVLAEIRKHPKILLQLSRLSNSNILINLIKNGHFEKTEVLQELIALGADVNASEKGKSVLEYIIDNGDAKLIVQAIRAGANVNVRLPFHIKRAVVETAYSKFTRSRYSHGDKFNAFNVTTFDSEKKEFALEQVDNFATAFDLDHEAEEKRQLVEDPTIFCRLCLADDIALVEEIIDFASSESLEKAFTLVLARGQIQMAKVILKGFKKSFQKDGEERVLENMLYRALLEGKSDAYGLILEALNIEPAEIADFHVIKRAKIVLNLLGRNNALQEFQFQSGNSRKNQGKEKGNEPIVDDFIKQVGNVTLLAVDDTDPSLASRCARTVSNLKPDRILLPLNSTTIGYLFHSIEGLAQQSKSRFDEISKKSALERTPEEEMQRTFDYRVIQSELWPFREAVATVEAAAKLEGKMPELVMAEPETEDVYRKVGVCKDRHKFEVYTRERLSDFDSYSKTCSKEFREKLKKTRESYFPEANEAYYGTKRDFLVSTIREHCKDRRKSCLCLVDIELFDSVLDALL